MTTITHPATGQLRRAALRDLVRRWSIGLAASIPRLRTEIRRFAAAGQLGPGPEIEMGRWTGARA